MESIRGLPAADGGPTSVPTDWDEDPKRRRAIHLAEISRQYYEEGMSQEQIARRIGYSRPTVSRMLEEARRTGVVRIQISHPLERLTHLEHLIESRYGVQHVRVTANSAPQSGVNDVGRAAAELLSRILRPGMTIGLSNGRTHMAMVESSQSCKPMDLTVVQMVGSLGGNNQLLDGPELCRRFANAYSSSYRVLNAPLFAPNARIAAALLSEPTISATLDLAAAADLAVVGIGASFRRPSGVFNGSLTPDHIRTLQNHGAVGHVLGQFINADGDVIDSPHKDLVIGLSVERLRSIPHVIAICSGAEKAAAIAAALRGNLVNSLILDSEAAQELAYLPVKSGKSHR